MKNNDKISTNVDKNKKPTELLVNTRLFEWSSDTICYNDLLKLALGSIPADPNLNFSIQFEKAGSHKPSGVLKVDDCIKVKHKMVFHVLRCNQS